MSCFLELAEGEGHQRQAEGECLNFVDMAAQEGLQLEGEDPHNFVVEASGGHLLPWGRLDWLRGED